MFKVYTVKDGDTIQRIAHETLGDSKRWLEIVEVNKLDYPYITENQDFVSEVPASGLVTISRENGEPQDLPIPAGVIVRTSRGTERQYITQGSATILAGAVSSTVEVVCAFSGIWGNVSSGAINVIDIEGLTVSNPSPLTNGAIYNVKRTGETLLIPLAEGTYAVIADYLADLGGTDLALGDGTLDTDVYGDLASATGLTNIAQSLQHRITTPRGSLVYHPTYGSNLHLYIGRVEPFIDKLIALDISETILQDTRISNVEVVSLHTSGTKKLVECNIILVGQVESQQMSFIL